MCVVPTYKCEREGGRLHIFFPSKEQLVVVVLQYKTMNRVLVPTPPLYSITSYCFIGSVWLHTFFLGLFFKWHGSKIGPNHKLINYYCLALIGSTLTTHGDKNLPHCLHFCLLLSESHLLSDILLLPTRRDLSDGPGFQNSGFGRGLE